MCPYDGYEKVGQEMTSHQLADLLLRDKAFYDESHGGVTFSGGEPALQAEFVRETALLLKAEGIHVCWIPPVIFAGKNSALWLKPSILFPTILKSLMQKPISVVQVLITG